jgi:uncharacterized protein (DUF2267 family)
MEGSDLFAAVEAQAGLDRHAAERAVRATLASIAEALSSDEADALCRELSPDLRPLVARHALALPLDRTALFAAVAARESVEVGFAVEHAECVCGALAERMSPDLRGRLQRHLPLLASLFELRDEPPLDVPPLIHGSTLASGRPGSRHPLSEARPERAQSQSVARSDEPHADTKLSSSRGVAEDREGRTMATAKRP